MNSNDKNGKFKKGTSGNPAGRPLGSRNQAMLECEHLLQAAAPDLIRVLIEKAKKGDMQAMRLCLDRIYPVKKEQPIHLALPPLKSATDLPNHCRQITNAVMTGEITPGQGESLTNILTGHAHILEIVDVDERLKDIEECVKERNAFHTSLGRLTQIIEKRKL
jgi:hypothetical protein